METDLSTRLAKKADVDAGMRLRAIRLAKKVGQVELGNAIGVSFQQIQKYESGENRLSASRLERASKFLGVPVSCFFNGESEQGENLLDSFLSFLSEKENMRLFQAFSQIGDDTVRRSILVLVESIADRKIASVGEEKSPAFADM